MRLIEKMADKIRHSVRSFLRIEQAQSNVVQIQEAMDFHTNIIKNTMWYRGDADELSQFYKAIISENNKTRFWTAVPTAGREIRKIHTGLPAMMIDTLVAIITSDINKIDVDDKYQPIWDKIAKENEIEKLLSKAITDVLVIGDGAFKISVDTSVSQYPILEFISGDKVEFIRKYGRIREVVFKTIYLKNSKQYVLEETYGYGYIYTKLWEGEKEVPLTYLDETKNLNATVTFNPEFTLAIPFKIYESKKWEGRGKSIIDGKSDNFDALDEAWSQWMDALRKGRAREYIPSNMLPRNPYTGEVLKPNPFDNAYIQKEQAMAEGSKNEIDVVQPAIPVESYLQTYITALDMCLQGIISPSTLGIDVKKLDNAEAQREKEKATLYSRNAIIGELQKTIPQLVEQALKAYATMLKQKIEDINVDVNFGEYANPSFESQVETIGKAKTQGIMSTEAAVEELYGDTKDAEWKAEEVIRLKAEQGIAEINEPDITTGIKSIDNEDESKSSINMLNGAQVSSLMNVIGMVKQQQLTRSEAISIIVATLGVSRENAESFIEEKL